MYYEQSLLECIKSDVLNTTGAESVLDSGTCNFLCVLDRGCSYSSQTMMLFWSIWQNWNTMIWNEKRWFVYEIWSLVQRCWQEWKVAHVPVSWEVVQNIIAKRMTKRLLTMCTTLKRVSIITWELQTLVTVTVNDSV